MIYTCAACRSCAKPSLAIFSHYPYAQHHGDTRVIGSQRRSFRWYVVMLTLSLGLLGPTLGAAQTTNTLRGGTGESLLPGAGSNTTAPLGYADGDRLLPQHLYLQGRPEKLESSAGGGGKISLQPQQTLRHETQAVQPLTGERINAQGPGLRLGSYDKGVSVLSSSVDVSAQARKYASQKPGVSEAAQQTSTAMILMISAASAVMLGAVYWKVSTTPRTRADASPRHMLKQRRTVPTVEAPLPSSPPVAPPVSSRTPSSRMHTRTQTRHRSPGRSPIQDAHGLRAEEAAPPIWAQPSLWEITPRPRPRQRATPQAPAHPAELPPTPTVPPWADSTLWHSTTPPPPVPDALPAWADAQLWRPTTRQE